MLTYKHLRQANDLSVSDLSTLLGISVSTIRRREKIDQRGRAQTREQQLALRALESELFLDRVVEADRQRQAQK